MKAKRSGFIAAVVFVLCFCLPFASANADGAPPAPTVVAGAAVDGAALAGSVTPGGGVAVGLLGLAGLGAWMNHDTVIPTNADTGPGTGGIAVNGYPSSQLVTFLSGVTVFRACGSCQTYYPISTAVGNRAFNATDVLWDSSLYAGQYGSLELGLMKVCPANGPHSQDNFGCTGSLSPMVVPYAYAPAQTTGGGHPGGNAQGGAFMDTQFDFTVTDANGNVTYSTTSQHDTPDAGSYSATINAPGSFAAQWDNGSSPAARPIPMPSGGTATLSNITIKSGWGGYATQITAQSEVSLVMSGGEFLRVDVQCVNAASQALSNLTGFSLPLIGTTPGTGNVPSCQAHNGASWSPQKVTVSYVNSSGTTQKTSSITYPAPTGTTQPVPGTAGQTVISYDPTTKVSVTTATEIDTSPQVIAPPVITTTGAPQSDTKNCLGGMSVFNPISWVEKPVECAFEWAFVPSGLPNLTLTGTHPQLDKWALPTPSNLWPGEGGCGGIGLTMPHKYFNDYSTTYLNTCNAPYASIKGWVYSVSMVGVLMYGVWTCYGLLTSGFGIRLWDRGPDGSGQMGLW